MEKMSDHFQRNAQKWNLRAETYDKKRFDFFRMMQERTIALLPVKPEMLFLDMGCGTGWAVCHVAGLAEQRGAFYGIDLAPKMIEKAKENSRDSKNVYFYEANAEALAFENDFFDVILCTNSFHHYPHPAKALDEVRCVLKPGGQIGIMDFTADGPILRMIDRVIKSREPEHVRFYSTQEYRSLYAQAKLKYVAAKMIAYPMMKVHIGEK